jgi:hypothetical protein
MTKGEERLLQFILVVSQLFILQVNRYTKNDRLYKMDINHFTNIFLASCKVTCLLCKYSWYT